MDGPSLFIYNWLIGWAAAALASTIAMPFDTVKRVLMTDTYGSTKRYRNMLHCWASLVEEDGIMRLWRGIYKLYQTGPQMQATLISNLKKLSDVRPSLFTFLGSVSNLIRSWSSGLALAGFTFLEDITFEHDTLLSCKNH